MPNIKIYGLTKEEAFTVELQIRGLFKGESYADEVVITTVSSEVRDLQGLSQPYLQLELCCVENYEKKVDLLKEIGMDIQVVKLHEFIPKTGSIS